LLQARYYDGSKGEFLSEDPVFWGDPRKQDLQNPQDLNSYSYGAGNPITRSDPSGLWFKELATGQQSWSGFKGEWNMAASQLSQDSSTWNFAMTHPVATGMLVVGPLSGVAAASGIEGFAAARAATTPLGVSAAYRAKQAFAGLVYLALGGSTLSAVPDGVDGLRQGDPNNPSTYFGTSLSLMGNVVPGMVGGRLGAVADANQMANMITKPFGSSGSIAYSNSMQMRVGLTNVYNAAAGSSNANKLWVTPNGAVVTWAGGVVAGGIKQ
jgi:RHS repeat-associated protein